MTDAVTDATTPPYEQWTVRELRDELRTRGLSTLGTKDELAARLADADREPADMTVAELKDELRERDEPTTGTKDELVERLEAAGAGDSDAAADTDTDPDSDSDTGTDSDTDRLGRPACVVDDGTAHTGRATPGAKICSAHAMHYKADGTPRAEYVQQQAETRQAEDEKAETQQAEDVKRDE